MHYFFVCHFSITTSRVTFFYNHSNLFVFFSFPSSSVDLPLAMSVLPKAVATLTQLWMAQKTEVATAATHALELLLKDAVAPACLTADLVQQHHSKLLKCFNLLEQGLSYQYHNVWHQVLYTLKVMFEVSEFWF